MEAMEVDVVQRRGDRRRAGGQAPGPQPDVGPPAPAAAPPAGGRSSHTVVIDSGSSTDIDDDEEEGGPSVAPHAARLPTTWAFSQRAETRDVPPIRAAARAAATQVTTRRRRVRQGLRVHYPSQTANANPSRGFLDFLLRAPAANVAEPGESGGSTTEPMSGSTTEVSDSDDEEQPVPRHHAAAAGAPLVVPAPADLALPPTIYEQHTPLLSLLYPALYTVPPTAVTVRTEATPQSVQTSSSSAASVPAVSAPAPSSSSAVAAPSPLPSSQGGDEDGDNNCPVCFEPFTSAGVHRLAALRCGHLFGFACIDRWLKSQGQAAKCPQCNKKAKRSDVVLLYARKLKPLDNSETESMKKSLEDEQSLRRRAELESAQCRLQLQVMTDECGKLRRQLQELKTLMSQANSGSSSSQHPSMLLGQSQRAGDASRSTQGAQYKFNKAVLVSQTGGCRVLAYCEPLSCLLASQNSPHSTLVPGCGVKKISAVNMKASQYVPIHAKQIRGLSFNRQADSLMLSASLDNTIKLTSLMTNTVVQTYNTGKPVWSCCWSLDNNNYVYAGLLNGAVLVYDTRDTSTHVHELQPQRSRCPVASLCFVPRAASSSFPCGGLIVGTLEGAYFWEQVDGTTFKPHMLPLETSGCTDIQVETESRHCLVTYRPGRSHPGVRSVLMELQRTQVVQEALCSCNPVQTFSAGASCKLLTKNAVFSSPAGDGSTLVCVGDEASNSTLVWDAGTGALLQKLPADLPVLDISPFAVNGDHYLASLTEKMLKVYKWE